MLSLLCIFNRPLEADKTAEEMGLTQEEVYEMNQEISILICCHLSEDVILPTLRCAVRHVREEQIYIVHNGNSALPIDRTEEVCACACMMVCVRAQAVIGYLVLLHFRALACVGIESMPSTHGWDLARNLSFIIAARKSQALIPHRMPHITTGRSRGIPQDQLRLVQHRQQDCGAIRRPQDGETVPVHGGSGR